jgi:hypothetical protein
MRDNHDELDRQLDAALATYADPGPDSGLDQRILNRIAAEIEPAPRRRWLPWAIALPVAAGLLVFAVLSGTRPVQTPSNAPQQAHISQQPPSTSTEAANRLPSRPAPIHRAGAPPAKPHPRRAVLASRSAPLPKLEIFPTVRPLSPQEETLVNFAAQASKSERESLVSAQQEGEAPLRVAAIEIKPLEPPAAGAN